MTKLFELKVIRGRITMVPEAVIIEWASKLQSENQKDVDNLFDYILSQAENKDFGDVPSRITTIIHRSGDMRSLLRVSMWFMEHTEFQSCIENLAWNVCVYCKEPRSGIRSLDRAHRMGALSGEMLLFTAVQHARIGNVSRAKAYIAEAKARHPHLAAEVKIQQQVIDFYGRFDLGDSKRMLQEIEARFQRKSVADVEKEIFQALDTCTPYLLLRLGDGEGCCTIVDDDDDLRYQDYYRANRREFVDIWFKEPSVLDDPEFSKALRAFNQSIPAANCIGGIYAEAIDNEYGLGSRRGIAWVVNTMRKVLQLSDRDPAWAAKTSVHHLTLHYDLVLTGALARLLRGRGKVGLISCHDELPEALVRTYGVQEIEFHKVPGEQAHRETLGANATDGTHWPYRYRELCAEFDRPVDRRGQLFLIAAGMLGKIYAAKLKKSGAVVVDIGAVADLWMGKITRWFPRLTPDVALKPKLPLLTLVDVGGLGGIGIEWEPYIQSLQPILFEPNPPEAQAIRDRFAGSVVIERALSNRAERRILNVAKSLGCSSLLTANNELLHSYSIEPAFRVTHTVEVECVRYDTLVELGQVPLPDVIKIDVQGFEHEVLEGFGDTLFNCLGIKLEAHFYPIYEGQKLLCDLVRLLEPFGLALRRITPVDHFDGDIVEVDAWFTCNATRTVALDPERKAKLSFIEMVWGLSAHRRIFGPDQFA